MKIAVVGLLEADRARTAARVRELYPDAEVVECTFGEYKESEPLDHTIFLDEALTFPISVRYLPPGGPLTGLGFEKRGRRRGQRRKEAPWRSR